MSIETRVQNFWDHLIESANRKTRSLLIWDTGTCEMLPKEIVKGRNRRGIPSPQSTADEDDDSVASDVQTTPTFESETGVRHENDKLNALFQIRYVRLRLHSTCLPKDYTVILRLPTNQIIKSPTVHRKSRKKPRKQQIANQSDYDADNNLQGGQNQEENVDTDPDEDAETRATNDIGSVHQRHWFLQLDRQCSGFVLDQSGTGKEKWTRELDGTGFELFLVRGCDHERNVVTGRLAREVESDEGAEGYVGRGK